MKKRHFLQIGISAIGTAYLSSYLFGKKQAMADSKKSFKFTKTEQEWRKILTPQQFYVLRQKGTERAYSSPLDKQYNKGIYQCVGCNSPLFSSETKFNSGTGWPSFYAPITGAIATSIDRSFLITRIEVHCQHCGGHLVHVFNDGPPPTGKRYCMNGVALKFVPA